ncbi:hypothetical protein WJX82_003667 [Trebouxia sp. C0006]
MSRCSTTCWAQEEHSAASSFLPMAIKRWNLLGILEEACGANDKVSWGPRQSPWDCTSSRVVFVPLTVKIIMCKKTWVAAVLVMLGKWMFVTLRTGGTPGAVAAILDEASGLTASRGNCSAHWHAQPLVRELRHKPQAPAPTLAVSHFTKVPTFVRLVGATLCPQDGLVYRAQPLTPRWFQSSHPK